MTTISKPMVAVAVLAVAGAGAWWVLGSKSEANATSFGQSNPSARTGVAQTTPSPSSEAEKAGAEPSQAAAPAWLKAKSPTEVVSAMGLPASAVQMVEAAMPKANATPAELAKERERLERVRMAAQRLREVSTQKNADPKAVVAAMKELEVANGGPMLNGVDLSAIRKNNELLLGVSAELQSMQAMAERVERGDKTLTEAEYKAVTEKMRKLHEQVLNNAPALPPMPQVPTGTKPAQ
ncbi:hypothetical protein [Ideonella paludis]|uniref:Uncharacterized protein n=1 Tax=Ideonella paludis TaxID=1233411 RepID=A0ABS5E322_9BURK|nr:hypothetical protein [Ideonella paludis]MBQ0937817.1 hypothetical protein [Ideonella paludis]